ncbi:MAG: helix-turn-helix domain-containing protein [Sphingobium sp.]|nr:helix-turn-helix domain-containing protein [Sphingobium sp.]
MTPKMLSTADAARQLGLAPYTLRRWRHEGKGPRFVKLGRCQQAVVIYYEDDVQAFLAARTFASTSAVTVSHPDA